MDDEKLIIPTIVYDDGTFVIIKSGKGVNSKFHGYENGEYVRSFDKLKQAKRMIFESGTFYPT